MTNAPDLHPLRSSAAEVIGIVPIRAAFLEEQVWRSSPQNETTSIAQVSAESLAINLAAGGNLREEHMNNRTYSLRRGWIVIAGAAGLILASTAAQACSVDLGRGWARGGGNGTLVMAKGGKNCGGTLWVNPGARLPVTSLKVASPPRNGTIVTRGNSFQYTPKAGFQGQDSFSLTGAGPDQAGAMTTLTGNVAVTVQ